MTERVSDELLQAFSKMTWGATLPDVIAMATELLERRRGEYICPKCGLRQQDVEPERGDF